MIRALLHVKKPEADGTYVLLASSAAWKRLALSAHWKNPVVTDVDLAERIKGISDLLVLADGAIITFTKVVQDQIAFVDSISYSGSFAKADTATATDEVGKVVDKPSSDNVTASDVNSFSFSKLIADIVSLVDSVGFVTSIPDGVEALTTIDAIALVISRASSDSVSASDQQSMTFTKVIDEIITMVDGVNVVLGGISSADNATVTDVVALVIQKDSADTVVTTDAVALVLQSFLSDNAALSDDIAKAITKSSTDAVSISDDFLLFFVYGRTSILNGFALNEASLND